MDYCVTCGTKLEEKFLEKEGMIPYCSTCEDFCFPTFSTAVSAIIFNQTEDKILLIQQYGTPNFRLIAGYLNKGEAAEPALLRELQEEVGVSVASYRFNKSEYYERNNTLMLNFACKVSSEVLTCDKDEIDYAEWFSIAQARKKIEAGSLAQTFMEHFLQSNPQGLKDAVKVLA